MAKPVYFTICSKNYLAYALTLGRSLREADEAARFVIFLADTDLDEQAAARIEFEIVPARALDLPNLADMAVRYSIMEFNTAIKPACFRYLFEREEAETAVYLDPDILVLRPLEHVERALEAGAELVLTPHALSPLDDGGDPDDLRLLRTGVYNLGFAAFARSPSTARFLHWWNARLATDCRVALDDGIFVDQKWMDLAPAYIERTEILRHPGYNAAYWNLYGRAVTREKGEWLAAGQPLHFFHFSGVVPGHGDVFSKHQTRFTIGDIGELTDLLHDYLRRLELNGHADWKEEPYGFALPADMKGIDIFARAAFQRAQPEPVEDLDFDPAGLEAICNAPSREITGRNGGRVTNLTFEIWAQRPDLRRTFDLSRQDGREGFNSWLLTSGAEEHDIPARFLSHLTAPAKEKAVLDALPLRARIVHEILRRRGIVRPLARRLPQGWVNFSKRSVQALMSSSAPAATPASAPAGTGQLKTRVPLAVYGYFNAESGLGQAVRREFRALRGAGLPAVARPVSAAAIFAESENFEFGFDAGEASAEIHLVHVNADQTLVAEQWASPETFDPAHYRIGFWAWELERFPGAWARAFDRLDEIWVPSRFVAEAVSAETEKPVRVFPHPVPVPASTARRDEARLHFALPQTGVLFLSLFDFNSFAERKNPMGVLDAFEQARQSAPGLGLVLKCHGGTRHDREREQILSRARRMENVFIIDRVLDADGIDRLYAACDGLISLHRSEGFGLTIAEAMARGLAVVATDYSGNRDFFDAEVGEAISARLIPVRPDAYPHGAGARWADPDVEAAARALVRLAGDEAYRERLGRNSRARVIERLLPDRVGRAMVRRIDEILQERRAPDAADAKLDAVRPS